MRQKIKKSLQVLAIIGIIYFICRIFFVHYPNKDIENMLISIIGLFVYGNLFINTLTEE